MKHSEDQGNLTLFSDGDEILIACDRGHYWTFRATSGQITPPSADADRDVAIPETLERFGPAAMEALRADG